MICLPSSNTSVEVHTNHIHAAPIEPIKLNSCDFSLYSTMPPARPSARLSCVQKIRDSYHTAHLTIDFACVCGKTRQCVEEERNTLSRTRPRTLTAVMRCGRNNTLKIV